MLDVAEVIMRYVQQNGKEAEANRTPVQAKEAETEAGASVKTVDTQAGRLQEMVGTLG